MVFILPMYRLESVIQMHTGLVRIICFTSHKTTMPMAWWFGIAIHAWNKCYSNYLGMEVMHERNAHNYPLDLAWLKIIIMHYSSCQYLIHMCWIRCHYISGDISISMCWIRCHYISYAYFIAMLIHGGTCLFRIGVSLFFHVGTHLI